MAMGGTKIATGLGPWAVIFQALVYVVRLAQFLV